MENPKYLVFQLIWEFKKKLKRKLKKNFDEFELVKEKRWHVFYRLFCPKEIVKQRWQTEFVSGRAKDKDEYFHITNS